METPMKTRQILRLLLLFMLFMSYNFLVSRLFELLEYVKKSRREFMSIWR